MAPKKAAAGGETKKPRPRRTKKPAAEPKTRGLEPGDVAAGAPPAEVRDLSRAIEADGGRVLGCYRDPLGGNWQVLAALPVDRIDPTPFQRDLSQPHVGRLADVMDRLDRFLDPVIAVRTEDGRYWTPNGHHRTAAVRKIGGRSIVALVLPDEKVAYRILALNTEKAHNLREKSLEVIRMARSLAGGDAGGRKTPRERGARPGAAEKDFALEFEEPAFLTLGICYERRGRLAGGAYHPVLRRVEEFLDEKLARALEVREARAARILELDDAVGEAVARLKERGFESPYLRALVLARINPLRFQRGPKKADCEATLEKMLDSARRFDPSKVRAEHVARASGPPASEE